MRNSNNYKLQFPEITNYMISPDHGDKSRGLWCRSTVRSTSTIPEEKAWNMWRYVDEINLNAQSNKKWWIPIHFLIWSSVPIVPPETILLISFTMFGWNHSLTYKVTVCSIVWLVFFYTITHLPGHPRKCLQISTMEILEKGKLRRNNLWS